MSFRGDVKTGKSLFHGPEQILKNALLPHIPRSIETYHLTLTTLLWSALIPVFAFLARSDVRWLWAASLMIVMQYLTDLLDGAIGRLRNTGLVKWGYYMDHFLDYLFLCSILIGYSILLPQAFRAEMFFVMAMFGAFMVNSFLSFACTQEFCISYMGIGPTEVRLLFIVINSLLIFFGVGFLVRAIPYVVSVSTFGLFVTVYRTQRELWRRDMQAKREGNRS
ncbi:MAG: CDP-alcohol phosphatidyltransferase family protein [Kiritimatiellae bacterium]|nr:CDP-alcohol phosphatidyltransferase family protein [Kiritimatiellia bacterium]